MLSWDLEDWIADAGDAVIQKKASQGYGALTSREQLLYEIWLFDTEARNGGVSQYFCNQETGRWQTLLALASVSRLPNLPGFAAQVQSVVAGADDPYDAVINSAVDLDATWEQHQSRIVSELRAFVERAD